MQHDNPTAMAIEAIRKDERAKIRAIIAHQIAELESYKSNGGMKWADFLDERIRELTTLDTQIAARDKE